jgi:hypothetical protein
MHQSLKVKENQTSGFIFPSHFQFTHRYTSQILNKGSRLQPMLCNAMRTIEKILRLLHPLFKILMWSQPCASQIETAIFYNIINNIINHHVHFKRL